MKITVISEIGINFMGNMNIARKMIADAAECGADIAKFQWYSCFDLFGNNTKDTYNKDIYEKVKPFELDEKKIEQLIKWCDLEGIEFGCSVFDRDRFFKIDSMGAKRHKIASRVSKFDRQLAEEILSIGKETFVSLGFGAESFNLQKYPNCKQLYCVASYPTEYNEIHFPKSFDETIYCGFSSHAMTIYPAMVAMSRGAKIIEVHFTLDKSMAALPGGLDHICSLDKEELKQIVDFARQIEKMEIL